MLASPQPGGRPTPADTDALYGRVSGDQQEKEETIKTQLFEIERKFGPEGRPVCHAYLDNPFTGTLLNRPALDRLIADARNGRFNRVLIYDPDRLSRGEPWHRGFLEAQLADAGVAVAYVKYVKLEGAMGGVMDAMRSALAGYEREQSVERMSGGRDRRLSLDGIWRHTGITPQAKRPYGWRYVPGPTKKQYGHLEQVPEEARIVREVFDLVLAGVPASSVARRLEDRGLRTATGAHWGNVAVQRIIHNPINAGLAVVGRYTRVKPVKPSTIYHAQRKGVSQELPRDQWRFVALPTQIVTREEWERAEACLRANQKLATRNGKRSYLLTGLVRCGHDLPYAAGTPCGRGMSGSAVRHEILYYRCGRNRRSDFRMTGNCPGYIRADYLEAEVWAQMVTIMEQPDLLRREMERANAAGGDQRARLTGQLDRAQARLARARDDLKALARKNVAGEVDDETAAALRPEYLQARDGAAGEVTHLEAELAGLHQEQARWDELLAYCQDRASQVAGLVQAEPAVAFAIKQRLLREWLTAVWVYPDGTVWLEGKLPALRAGTTDPIVIQSLQCMYHNQTPATPSTASFARSFSLAAGTLKSN